jgi:hypothetical protein
MSSNRVSPGALPRNVDASPQEPGVGFLATEYVYAYGESPAANLHTTTIKRVNH